MFARPKTVKNNLKMSRDASSRAMIDISLLPLPLSRPSVPPYLPSFLPTSPSLPPRTSLPSVPSTSLPPFPSPFPLPLSLRPSEGNENVSHSLSPSLPLSLLLLLCRPSWPSVPPSLPSTSVRPFTTSLAAIVLGRPAPSPPHSLIEM